MLDLVNQVIDRLVIWLEAVGQAGEPMLVILVNVVVVAVMLVVAWSRFEAMRRSQQWLALTPDEKRRKIWDILQEAWEVGEWLYSHVQPEEASQKLKTSEAKKEAAVEYAKRELQALGADYAAIKTIPTRIERVAMQRKGDYQRYTGMPWALG